MVNNLRFFDIVCFSCVPLREELLVCVKNGYSHHISWDGAVKTEFTIRLASVPFAHDQLQSKRILFTS